MAERLHHRRDLVREGSARHVEPEPAQFVTHGGALLRADAEHGAEQLHPVGEQRQHAPTVGDDPLDAGVAAQDLAEQQIGDGAGGVEEELHHGAGSAQRHGFLAGRRGGVDEDGRVPVVEVAPQGLETRVAEVMAGVVALDGDAVAAEGVQGVRGLGQ
ncbi:hypothetical protein GCM10010129_77990 [Streptomyces fumigatiscleroticus]|nr:hypothetical protein GCM10010129_77990 [Streptomyces fumigatiscleroticus]